MPNIGSIPVKQLNIDAPLPLSVKTVAEVPNATLFQGHIIFIADETGGSISAFSDGANWLRVTDRAIVS